MKSSRSEEEDDVKLSLQKAQNIPVWYKASSLITLVVTSTATVLMLRYSRTMPLSGLRYLNSSAVTISEVVKVYLSLLAIFVSCGYSASAMMQLLYVEMTAKPKEMLKMAVPALLYVFQNNLLFLALSNLDAATYQVTYQCKILTTAFLSVVMLGKRLDRLKWFSLVVLMVGVIIVQFPSSSSSTVEKRSLGSQAVGLTAVFIACLTSGFAGVYLELVLKTTRTSLWVRNLQLALFSVVAAFLTMILQDGSAIARNGIFQGYGWVTWVVVMLQAGGGLVIALVVKYADNILKVFATSISIICSCILSYFLLGDFTPSVSFAFGAMLVIGSTVLYGYERKQPNQESSNIVRWKRRGKSDYDFFLPFVLGWLGSILWSLYGYFACNWQVIAVNGLLTIVNSVVLVCLIIYRIRKRTVIIFTSVVAASVGLLMVQLSRMPSKVSANIVGTICSTLQILCALTMIYVINRAISKQRIDFVPFPPVAQIFNIELQVSIYSIIVKDYYLLISNGIFMLIDGMVFALFFVYPSDVAEKQQRPERKLIEA